MALCEPLTPATWESCFGNDADSGSGQPFVKNTETLAGEDVNSPSQMDFLQKLLDANYSGSSVEESFSDYLSESAIFGHNLFPEDEKEEHEPNQEGLCEHGLSPTFATTPIQAEGGPSDTVPPPLYIDPALWQQKMEEVKAVLRADPKTTQPSFPNEQPPVPIQQFPVQVQQFSVPVQRLHFPAQPLSFLAQPFPVGPPNALTMQQAFQMFPGSQPPQPSFMFPPHNHEFQPLPNIPYVPKNGPPPGMRPVFMYSPPPYPNSNGYVVPQPNLFTGGSTLGPGGLVYPAGNGFYGMMPPQPGQFMYAPPSAANNINRPPPAAGTRQFSAASQAPAQGPSAGPSNLVHPSDTGFNNVVNPQPGQFVYAPLGVVNNIGHFPQSSSSQQVSDSSQMPARTIITSTANKRPRKDSEAPAPRNTLYACQWEGKCETQVEGTVAALTTHLETGHGCKQSVEDEKAPASLESQETLLHCAWSDCTCKDSMSLDALSRHIVETHLSTSAGKSAEAKDGGNLRPTKKMKKAAK